MTQKAKHHHLHFVGIGGIGMSGIAEVFFNQGYKVSGSDMSESETTRRLVSLGITVHVGHRASNVEGAQVVVISSAVRPSNPEVVEAKKNRVPVIPRAEMLGELMRGRTGIAVGGTHGKTTTTSMMGAVLMEAGLDPTVVVGGKVDSLGGNAKLGQGNLVIAEADESDGSFLHLPATYAVITNVDNDHLDHFKTVDAIEDLFVDFVGHIPFYGMAAVCGEDSGVKRCLSRFMKPFVTYGLSKEFDYWAEDIQTKGLESRYTAHIDGKVLGEVTLYVPGRHNVLNSLAVVALASHLGVPFATIQAGLKKFRGVKRRFEIRWKNSKTDNLIIDDYGHHPTEIAATLAAARGYWPGRIVTVFQPHRYSRTFYCREGFKAAFRDTDLLLVTDIYAAGEEPMEGIRGDSLAAEIRATARGSQEVVHVSSLEQARDLVVHGLKPGDLILCLGAGSITKLADQLLEKLDDKLGGDLDHD